MFGKILVERQPEYLEETSPSVLGAQYFVVPPPGLLQVKGKDVIEMLDGGMPRRPRSILLSKKQEEDRKIAETNNRAENQETIRRQMRNRKIDDARVSSLKEQEKTLLMGRISSPRTLSLSAVPSSTTKVPELMLTAVPRAPLASVMSPLTTEARAFLSAREVETSSNAILSPAQKRTLKLIDSAKERLLARGEEIVAPKDPKRSNAQRFRQLRNPSRGDDVGGSLDDEQDMMAFNNKVAEPEESASSKNNRELKNIQLIMLKFCIGAQYMCVLRQQAEYETTADLFRSNESFSRLLVRCQHRYKKRFRRNKLISIWIARGRVIAATVRFVRTLTLRKRNSSIVLVKKFLVDVVEQCQRTLKLKHFHRCVIKAQRFARSFIQCSRCRVRLLFLRLTKSLRISKTDPSNQEHLQSGLEMLRNFGKHLVYQMLAKLRKAYIISRKDYFRRIKENDTAPGFSEIDIWRVKEFLMEGVDTLPPQYRGDFMSRPLFRLFSRQYLDQELKELCTLALGLKISQIDLDQMRRKKGGARGEDRVGKRGSKMSVRIRDPPPPMKKVLVKRVRKKVIKDAAGNLVGADKEANALLKVLQGRLVEWKRNVAMFESDYPEDDYLDDNRTSVDKSISAEFPEDDLSNVIDVPLSPTSDAGPES